MIINDDKFLNDIAMDIGMEKCAVGSSGVQSGVQVRCCGIVLPDDKTRQRGET